MVYLNLYINGCWNNVNHYIVVALEDTISLHDINVYHEYYREYTNAFKREYSIFDEISERIE